MRFGPGPRPKFRESRSGSKQPGKAGVRRGCLSQRFLSATDPNVCEAWANAGLGSSSVAARRWKALKVGGRGNAFAGAVPIVRSGSLTCRYLTLLEVQSRQGFETVPVQHRRSSTDRDNEAKQVQGSGLCEDRAERRETFRPVMGLRSSDRSLPGGHHGTRARARGDHNRGRGASLCLAVPGLGF